MRPVVRNEHSFDSIPPLCAPREIRVLTSFSGASILFGVAGFLLVLALDFRRRHLNLGGMLRLGTLGALDLVPAPATFACAAALVVRLYPEAAREGVVHLRTVSFPGALLCLLFAPVFWTEGRKQIQFQRPAGLIFGEWLFFAGACVVLLAPVHSGDFCGALWSLPLLLCGALMIALVVPPFLRKYEGLRILETVAGDEQLAQPEYTPPTPECPQPDLWKMLDSQTTEVEVLNFLKTLVTTTKPKLIVETGTFLGHGTLKLAEGAKENGFGRVITVEFDPAIQARALERFKASGLGSWIESRLESSLESKIDETVDLLYSDSHLANREAEVRRLLPQLDPRGLLVIHDASSHFKIVREAVLRMEAEGLISVVLLSTPRGLAIAQRREGRK
jgi:predicted O-methyltransferase YrrM